MTVVDFYFFQRFRVVRFFRRPLYKDLLRKKDGGDFLEFCENMSWARCFGKGFWVRFRVFRFSDDRCTKSSFGKKTGLIFSNFPKKCLGTGASEKLFGPSRGFRRGSGSRLRGSWGSPGRSGGRLGRVLGALGAILERPSRQSDFGLFF